MEKFGYTIIKNIFNIEQLDIINDKIYNFLEIKNNKYNRNDNCLHHILCYDKFFCIEILEKLLKIDKINNYFESKYIMHSFGAVINKPNQTHYTHNFHIDSYENNCSLMLNILIPLTDFTLENGCTMIYPKNSDTYENILLNKGDLLIFNSSLLHATGNNKSLFDRNCLTLTFIKKYCKPQFNYFVLYNEIEKQTLSNEIKELFNFDSQIYENLEDFYQKKYNIK
jgi:ectoine hydroxylase-related dioxygenase (phytanoyl-CoA dioxygenase family)